MRGGAKFPVSVCWIYGGHIHTNNHTHECWIHTGDWIGIRAITVAFSHPQDTAANPVLARDLSFIISFPLLFPLHSLVLFAVCILPRRPSKNSSIISAQLFSSFPPLSLSLSFCLCLPPPRPSLHALQRPVKCAPAVQAVGTVYHGPSLGSPVSTTPHAYRALTTISQVFNTWWCILWTL